MCGRFAFYSGEDALRRVLPSVRLPGVWATRYNIAPGQPLLAVVEGGIDFFLWGFIPSWSKDPAIGSRLINARAETLAVKNSFRAAFRRRRCLLPADGFYEWRGKESPYFIRARSGEPLLLGGIWEDWHSPDGGQLSTCAIVTTAANATLAPLHGRMPLIIPAHEAGRWLTREETPPRALADLLAPAPNNLLTVYPVSTRVNSVRHDDPACIEPTSPGSLFG